MELPGLRQWQGIAGLLVGSASPRVVPKIVVRVHGSAWELPERMMLEEQWFPVDGYGCCYMVSNMGRVYGFRGILKPWPDGGGYMKVTLYGNGKPRAVSVHKLVLEAFHGKKPIGMESCHRDGDKLNNRADNLYWGTKADNGNDRSAHGRLKGSGNPRAKLTEADVLEIRNRYASGECGASIAMDYPVTEASVYHVIWGLTWRHVV